MSDQPPDEGRALVLVFDTYSTVVPVTDATTFAVAGQLFSLQGCVGVFLAESQEDAALIDIFSA